MAFSRLTFKERASYCLSPMGSRLLQLLDEKETNLAVSADVISATKLLELADQVGPHICILKTHIDIIEDYSAELIQTLRKLAQKHHFLLFEDRKFADIGHTVRQQYAGGIYQISNWADITNAHSLPGPGIIQGLADIGRKKNRGLLLLAELSSSKNLIDEEYTKKTLEMAEQFADFVIGFITQHAISADPHWINITPGIKSEIGQDKLGQQYVTPKEAICEHGTDIIIVGRGILSAKDPIAETKRYRDLAWRSYLKRCG